MLQTTFIYRKLRPLSLAVALSAALASAQGTWTPVFNGTDATGLKAFTKGSMKVEGGILIGTGQCCGYIGPEKSYSHYRMKVEFKHGGGNSGWVYHTDKWISGCRLPSGIELNVNDGGIKEIWWTDVSFKSTGSTSAGFEEGGAVVSKGGVGCSAHSSYKSSVAASLGTTAWNTFELYVKGDSMEAKLNDKVWMRVFDLKIGTTPLTTGRFGFLVEGSTTNIRKWEVMDLETVGVITPNKGENLLAKARPSTLRLNARGNSLEIVRSAAEGAVGRVYALDGTLMHILPALPAK